MVEKKISKEARNISLLTNISLEPYFKEFIQETFNVPSSRIHKIPYGEHLCDEYRNTFEETEVLIVAYTNFLF